MIPILTLSDINYSYHELSGETKALKIFLLRSIQANLSPSSDLPGAENLHFSLSLQAY